MTTHSINLHEAEGHLKELAELAVKGTEVIINLEDGGQLTLVPTGQAANREKLFGLYEGQIKMSEDFDDELPESYWLGETE